MHQQPLLVTGCYRSGTTLLEKLLHSHPEVTVASQPYPVLFIYAKKAFLESRGLSYRYPLDHLFKEKRYSREDFCSFLTEHRFSSDDVHRVFAGLADYVQGLWTPEILQFRSTTSPGAFLDISRQLNAAVASLFGDSLSRYVGSKEVLVEEYIPCLLDAGWSTVLIVRDPRDMIASLNLRMLDNKTGKKRPTLFSLRAWRKSVAYALGLEHHPRMNWIKYEDLVHDSRSTMGEIARSLRISPYDDASFDGDIKDQYGQVWSGNSSFTPDLAGVDRAPVGRFESILDESTIAFIEAACYSEMTTLGYEMIALSSFDPDALYDFRESADVVHEAFEVDYSEDPSRLATERRRAELLSDPASNVLSDNMKRAWFIHEEAYRRLSDGLRTRTIDN